MSNYAFVRQKESVWSVVKVCYFSTKKEAQLEAILIGGKAIDGGFASTAMFIGQQWCARHNAIELRKLHRKLKQLESK